MTNSDFVNQIPIDKDEVKRFYELSKTSTILSNAKWTIISVIFLVIAAISTTEKITYHEMDINIFNKYCYIFIPLGLISNLIIALLIHALAFGLVSRKYKFIEGIKIEIKKMFFVFISRPFWLFDNYLILSPDFHFACYYKGRIKEHYKIRQTSHKCIINTYIDKKENLCLQYWDSIKNASKFFIEYSNWLNLVYICFLVLLSFLFIYIENNFMIILFLTILIMRTFSRSIEIIIAFYKDVVDVDNTILKNINDVDSRDNYIYIDRWKNTSIRKQARISLAVHSLLEMALTFTILYFLVSKVFYGQILNSESIVNLISFNNLIQFDGPKHENIIGFTTYFYNFFFYSISLSFFNFSYTNYNLLLWNLLHVWQVIVSMVLIILSIASYLGAEDIMNERDKRFIIELEFLKDKYKKTRY